MKIYNLRRSIRSLLREEGRNSVNVLMRIVCEEINEYLTGKVCHLPLDDEEKDLSDELSAEEIFEKDPDLKMRHRIFPMTTKELNEAYRLRTDLRKAFAEPPMGKRPDWVDEPEYPVYSLESTISHMKDELEKGNGILDIVRLSDMLMYLERYQKLRSILRASRIEWIRNSCSNETIDLRDIL